MVRQAKDLSPEQRRAIEGLLGRPISADEAVSVQTLRSSVRELTPEERADALERIERYFERVHAKRKAVTADEESKIVEEALRSVRPGYRPLR